MPPALRHLDSLRRARCPDSKPHVRPSDRCQRLAQYFDLLHPMRKDKRGSAFRTCQILRTMAARAIAIQFIKISERVVSMDCHAAPHPLLSAAVPAGLLLQEFVAPLHDDRQPRSQRPLRVPIGLPRYKRHNSVQAAFGLAFVTKGFIDFVLLTSRQVIDRHLRTTASMRCSAASSLPASRSARARMVRALRSRGSSITD